MHLLSVGLNFIGGLLIYIAFIWWCNRWPLLVNLFFTGYLIAFSYATYFVCHCRYRVERCPCFFSRLVLKYTSLNLCDSLFNAWILARLEKFLLTNGIGWIVGFPFPLLDFAFCYVFYFSVLTADTGGLHQAFSDQNLFLRMICSI